MLIAFFLAAISAAFISYYVWYLTWSVVEGKVLSADSPISNASHIRSPRHYRSITFSYTYRDETCTSSRQGFFVKAAMGPRRQQGDDIAVSICRSVRSLSSPYRPIFEGLILLGILLLFSGVSMLAILPA